MQNVHFLLLISDSEDDVHEICPPAHCSTYLTNAHAHDKHHSAFFTVSMGANLNTKLCPISIQVLERTYFHDNNKQYLFSRVGVQHGVGLVGGA